MQRLHFYILQHFPLKCHYSAVGAASLFSLFPFLFILPPMDSNDPRVKKNITELTYALAKTNDSNLIGDFLYCLLTPAEIADIAARWALVKALRQKIPQREIAKDLGVSLCKITRGSKELKKTDSAFARIFALKEP